TEQFEDGVTGFKRFVEIIDSEPEKDDPDALPLSNPQGKIDFVDVSFHYGENEDVLRGISLHIAPGEKLALVGPSGGGKTTICHLLPRFYKVQQGEIDLDGTPINKIRMDSLRNAIGIVQQDVFLFDGTIEENIRYGKLDASMEDIIAAAKKARLYDYVMSLPDGFQTQVGERGVRLSGGQKQRISIARVFLKDPSILILDEATSALDNVTELLIQEALDELCKGRTCIVVAHRLSTIKTANRIAVIANGEVREIGSHEELMKKEHGIYAGLYNLQFRASQAEGYLPDDFLLAN
ncbi:MAG: ATP-binding cassette domain-containing protein, partial [Bacilli bacterium]|nr:ATP-binding cassette domain-containing protein [Bacilli bacterium]